MDRLRAIHIYEAEYSPCGGEVSRIDGTRREEPPSALRTIWRTGWPGSPIGHVVGRDHVRACRDESNKHCKS